MTRALNGERGATAVLVALVMVLLMGIAAIAIDLGFGFNERRQSQTAADMAVMAGATEVVLGGTQEQIVNQVLAFARTNVNTTYTDAEWQTLWQTCTDPDRLGFDVGTGTPVDFQPMPAPVSWGSGDLECISAVASYLRVRVPDQVVETTFARVMGFDEVITSAAAVARIDAGEALGSVVPFGVPAGVGAGHICLTTGSQAIEPCDPNFHGSFGTLASQFYGDYYENSQVCTGGNSLDGNLNNPPTMIQNVALGIDHAIALWPDEMAAQAGVSSDPDNPDEHPGNPVGSYPGIGFDRCRLDGSGSVVPFVNNHVTPPNALLTVSGNSAAGWIFDGLFVGGSNSPSVTFDGRLERDDDPNPKRTLNGNGQLSFDLNNRGLWDYLNGTNNLMLNGTPFTECDGDLYGGDILDPLNRDAKIERMHLCLAKYEEAYSGDPNAPEIFSDTIGDSPRLVWTPQFWHEEVPSQVYAPVRSFKLVFISGVWMGCSNECDLVFFPDELTTDDMSLSANINSMRNGFEQLSAFMVPVEAVPEDARPPIPGEDTAHTASLFR